MSIKDDKKIYIHAPKELQDSATGEEAPSKDTRKESNVPVEDIAQSPSQAYSAEKILQSAEDIETATKTADQDDIVLPEYNPDMENRPQRLIQTTTEYGFDLELFSQPGDESIQDSTGEPLPDSEPGEDIFEADLTSNGQKAPSKLSIHKLPPTLEPADMNSYDDFPLMDPEVGTIGYKPPQEEIENPPEVDPAGTDNTPTEIPWRGAESERTSEPLQTGVIRTATQNYAEFSDFEVSITEGERITHDFSEVSNLFPPDPTAWAKDLSTGEVRPPSLILPMAAPNAHGEPLPPSSLVGSEVVIGVKLREYGPVYFFRAGQLPLKAGHQVLVSTEQGTSLAYVTSARRLRLPLPKIQTSSGEEVELSPILGLAKASDIAAASDNKILSNSAKLFCKECIRERNLDMKLVDVEVLHDRSTIIFYFTAPTRIDFRELVKDLVRNYRTRIELRQIGVRHETQMLGAVGNCGMTCCCRRYLRKFAPVTIKMAKEQNLFLNPAKLSGICGRLLCCLAYEQENYEEFHRRSPKLGKRYSTSMGLVKVLRANLFRQSIVFLTENNEEQEMQLDEWNALNPVRSDAGPSEKEYDAAGHLHNNDNDANDNKRQARPRDKRHKPQNGHAGQDILDYTGEADDSLLLALEDKPERENRKGKPERRANNGEFRADSRSEGNRSRTAQDFRDNRNNRKPKQNNRQFEASSDKAGQFAGRERQSQDFNSRKNRPPKEHKADRMPDGEA